MYLGCELLKAGKENLMAQYNEWGQVTNRIPQGSVMESLLFFIYINGLDQWFPNWDHGKFQGGHRKFLGFMGPQSYHHVAS